MPNCVTLDSTGQVIQWAYSALVAGSGETLTNDCGLLVSGVPMEYNKIVGGVCTEMTAGEKTAVDAETAANAIGTIVYKSRRVLESIAADVNIEWRPYVNQITAYVGEISLSDGTQEGQEKKVYNDETGVAIFINGTYAQGTQMRINNNQFACLLWNGSLWRHIDGIVGVTFSSP